jgi:hypothetical protein
LPTLRNVLLGGDAGEGAACGTDSWEGATLGSYELLDEDGVGDPGGLGDWGAPATNDDLDGAA